MGNAPVAAQPSPAFGVDLFANNYEQETDIKPLQRFSLVDILR